jgi:hypothetical protein
MSARGQVETSLYHDPAAKCLKRFESRRLEALYRFLPYINVVSVRVARSSKSRYAEGLTLHAFSDWFHVRCGTPATFTYPRSLDVTASYCSASIASSPEMLLMVKFYIEAREAQRTINGHEDWPEIAREVEHLICRMQKTPE